MEFSKLLLGYAEQKPPQSTPGITLEIANTAFQAAGRYVTVEDSIFDALSDLPEMMDGARKYISIYRDHPDQSLERKTFDLYVAILKSLTHIMQFFADSSIREPLLFGGAVSRLLIPL